MANRAATITTQPITTKATAHTGKEVEEVELAVVSSARHVGHGWRRTKEKELSDKKEEEEEEEEEEKKVKQKEKGGEGMYLRPRKD